VINGWQAQSRVKLPLRVLKIFLSRIGGSYSAGRETICRPWASMTTSAAKPSDTAAQRRIPELDGLRGTAILSVVVWHYFYFSPDPSHRSTDLLHNLYIYFERCIAIGWSGVDLFFVLSGFLIGGILLNVRDSSSYFRTFYIRRFFRIVPIYYVWIILFILLAACSSHAGRPYSSFGQPRTWYEVGVHFFFVQNLVFLNYSGLAGAWFIAAWSLAVEEQFYLVAPFIVRLFSHRALSWFLILIILLAPCLRISIPRWLPSTGTFDLGYVLMPCRADSLSLGMLLAIIWRKQQSFAMLENNRRTLYTLFVIFLVGSIALNFYLPSHNSVALQSISFSWLAVFFSLLILVTLISPGGPFGCLFRMNWLRELGRVSYCIYLIHQVVNRLCHGVFLASPSDSPANWKTVAIPMVAIVTSYAIARLSWIYFEYPLQRRGHAFKY
jgi:peptidoglycan/LPS O-acetylase OafA/YrhL